MKFYDMSHFVRSKGKKTVQRAHCAVQSPDSSLTLEDQVSPSPPAEPPDILLRHRHFSIGGGETDPDRSYPMIDWMPYPEERPPPSF